MASKRVSILIACRNEVETIEAAVQSALRQKGIPEEPEIVVADGGSTDGTREHLELLAVGEPRLRVIDNPGQIASTGLNRAVAAAHGDILVRFDAHSEYAPDYVAACLVELERTGANNVGGPARTRPTTYGERAVAAAYHSPFSVGGARFHDPEFGGEVDTVTYGCWPRATFERFGLFDETLVRNQDDEHNLRIVRGGGKIWQSPSIQSWYRPRGSLVGLFRQYAQYGYWKVAVIRKHRLPASWRHLVPAAFVSGLALLAGLAPWWRPALWLLFVELSVYSAAVVVASLAAARRNGLDLVPALPAVFVTYHFAYGLGFLRGIVDFLLLRRGPAAAYSRLSRPTRHA